MIKALYWTLRIIEASMLLLIGYQIVVLVKTFKDPVCFYLPAEASSFWQCVIWPWG